MSDWPQEILVEIKGLMLDPASNVPIVILRDTENRLFLPIWIGPSEAHAIALRIEGVEHPRPMTHDLLRSILEQLGGAVEKIVISDLRESTFFALIHIQQGATILAVDARPSDAIAIALRTNTPIWVMEEVIADASIPVDRDADEAEQQAFRDFISNLRPEDLIKRFGSSET